MANITITKADGAAGRVRPNLPGWVWFVALWCAGAGGAMLLGAAFKVFMNVTLFAVMK